MISRISQITFFGLKWTQRCGFKTGSEFTKSDNIFKDYYSSRLVLNAPDFQKFLLQVSQTKFKQQDHRWQSLTQNIEKHIDEYNSLSQAVMLKALVKANSRVQLVESLFERLGNRISELGLEEVALLLWCQSKLMKRGKFDLLVNIFKRINELVNPQVDPQPPIRVLFRDQQDQTEVKFEGISIKVSYFGMILNSMGFLNIMDPPLLKRLIKDGIRPNLKDFSAQSLVVILIAFTRLRLNNKRDTWEIYKQLRNKAKELQSVEPQTLFGFMRVLTYLIDRKPSQQDKMRLDKHEDEKRMKEAQLQDLKHFFQWVNQTYLLRQKDITVTGAAKLLSFYRKMRMFNPEFWKNHLQILILNINEANVIDLISVLSALSSLIKENRSLFEKEEKVISERLWQLASSINAQSLAHLARLVKEKKVRPPSNILKMVNQYLIEEQGKKRELAKVRAQRQSKQSRGEQKNID